MAPLDPAIALDLPFEPGDRAYIRIFKEENILELWRNRASDYALAKSWPIARWSGTLGPKLREGDRQAPEGFYFFNATALNPNSRFHLGFNLGYPNAYDRAHDRTGSFLMVHGGDKSIGCYAMTDPVIDILYRTCEACFQDGQPFIRVHIFPFRMTDERLAAEADSPWFAFWQNLKEGHDIFLRESREPNVTVNGLRYAFE